MVKILIATVLLALNFTICYSQAFIMYDSKDYLKPSWLDPRNTGIDSLKKISYVYIAGGGGFNLNSVTGDDVYPNRYFGDGWLGASFYTEDVQLSFKNTYQLGQSYKKKDDHYEVYRNYAPRIQAGFYPLKRTKSYLGQQLRAQLSWSHSYEKTDSEEPAEHGSVLAFDFGGFVTPTDYNSGFPKTSTILYFSKGIDADFSASYGINIFSGILSFNPPKISNTLYVQFNYNRKVFEGNDELNFIRLGLVNELVYNKNKNHAFYFFINYTIDYYNGLSETNNSENKKNINLGVFFYLPVFSRMYYKY